MIKDILAFLFGDTSWRMSVTDWMFHYRLRYGIVLENWRLLITGNRRVKRSRLVNAKVKR